MRHAISAYVPLTPLRQDLDCAGRSGALRGAATVFYISSVQGAAHPAGGKRPVSIQPGSPSNLSHGPGLDCHNGPVPVVAEADAGLALTPVVTAVLLVASRRLRPAQAKLDRLGVP
jgi:hypothetical protein